MMSKSVKDGCKDEPEIINVFTNRHKPVMCVDFSNNSRYLISGGATGVVTFWNLKKDTLDKSYNLPGHDQDVNSVVFSPDDSFILTASKDTTVRIWKVNKLGIDAKKPSTSRVYKCHTASVRSVHVNHDSTQFCTSSDDKTVKLWNASSNKFISSFIGHNNWVRSAKFSYSSPSLIASCGDDSSVCIFDTRSSSSRGAPETKIACKKQVRHTCIQWYPEHDNIVAVGSQVINNI